MPESSQPSPQSERGATAVVPPILQRLIFWGGSAIPLWERGAAPGVQFTPIVLLHGLLASAETLLELIRELPTNRRIVVPDFLFFQRTQPESLSFAFVSVFLKTMLHDLQIDRAVFLGHSYGGALVLRFAASHPQRVDALILLGPAHPFGGHHPAMANLFLSPPGRLLARTIPSLPYWAHALGIRYMAGLKNTIDRQHVDRYRRILRTPGIIATVLRIVATWNNDMAALRQALNAEPVEAPTLLLWGDCDKVVPLTTVFPLLRRITLWEQSTLPGAGHLLADEAPVECGRLIRTWLIWRESQWKYESSRALRPASAQTPPPPTP